MNEGQKLINICQFSQFVILKVINYQINPSNKFLFF